MPVPGPYSPIRPIHSGLAGAGRGGRATAARQTAHSATRGRSLEFFIGMPYRTFVTTSAHCFDSHNVSVLKDKGMGKVIYRGTDMFRGQVQNLSELGRFGPRSNGDRQVLFAGPGWRQSLPTEHCTVGNPGIHRKKFN